MHENFLPPSQEGAVFPASRTPIPSADMLASPFPNSRPSPEVESLRQEVTELRQWKEEALQFLSANFGTANHNDRQQAASLNDGPSFDDPMALADFVADRAVSQVQGQMEIERLLNEFRGTHSDLKPFETSILLEAQQIAQHAAMHGIPLSDRDAITKAIEAFRSRLSVFNGVNSLNSPAPPDDGKALQHMALKLDTGSAAMDPQKISGDDIFHMPPDKFEKLRASIRQRQQFRSPF